MRMKLSGAGVLSALAVCLLGVGPLGATVARAEERPIALFVQPKKARDAGAATVLQALLRKEVRGLAGVRLVVGSPEPPRLLPQLVGEQVEAAYRALNDKDNAGALKLFQQAFKTLEGYRGTLNKRMAARILKGLGVSLVLTNQIAQGTKYIRASLNLWPDQAAADYGWAPMAVNMFVEAQNRAAEGKVGSIDIVTEPPGAEVIVGGDVRGFTPITVTDVPTGLQWVSVQADGYKWAGGFVDVKHGEEASEGYALEPIEDAASYNTLMTRLKKKGLKASKAPALLRGLTAFLSAQGVMYFQATQSRGEFVLDGWYFDGSAPRKIRQTLGGDELLDQAQTLLANTLGAKSAEEEIPPPLDAPPASSVVTQDDDVTVDLTSLGGEKVAEESVTGKWWFWAIVGGATAGVTAMLVALLSTSESGSGPVGNVVIDLHRP